MNATVAQTIADQDAMEAIYLLCSSVGKNIGVWQRGGVGKSAGNTQSRQIARVFEMLTGKKPTAEQLDAMSAGSVFGG